MNIGIPNFQSSGVKGCRSRKMTEMATQHPAEGKRPLRRAHVVRLMHYYHLLRDWESRGASETISSSQIAEWLDLDDTLVRKDLAAIGVRGCPRVGYTVADVIHAIHRILGFEEAHRAVVIGAGRLGGAIASYHGFAHYGLTIVGVFDVDPAKVGHDIAGHTVQPLAALREVVEREGADLAVLTLPADTAQAAVDSVVTAGIRALWNFAPATLIVLPTVKVRHEHLSTGFAELAYFLKHG